MKHGACCTCNVHLVPLQAEQDCTEALAADATFIKAWHRRGTARRAQGKLLEAAEDFEAALRLEPGSAALAKDRWGTVRPVSLWSSGWAAWISALRRLMSLQRQVPKLEISPSSFVRRSAMGYADVGGFPAQHLNACFGNIWWSTVQGLAASRQILDRPLGPCEGSPCTRGCYESRPSCKACLACQGLSTSAFGSYQRCVHMQARHAEGAHRL